MAKIGTWLSVWLVAAAMVGTARADHRADHVVKLDHPLLLSIRTTDGENHHGKLTTYNDQNLTLVGQDKHKHHIAWDDLAPRRVLFLHRHLIDPHDARAWLRLGVSLQQRKHAKRQVAAAFRRALRIDPSLKGEVQRARRGGASEGQGASVGDGEGKGADAGGAGGGEGAGGSGGGPGSTGPPTGKSGGDKAGKGGIAQGTQSVGYPQAKYWGHLDDKVMAKSVKHLKKFARDAQQRMNLRLHLYETKYFLFYSDIGHTQARRWAGLLDKMYARMCGLFGIRKGRNIYRGKCLIMVFSHNRDYQRFEQMMYQTIATGTAGMTHTYGSGYVHIAFYRQPNTGMFGHVLVHENVHGFLHRFHSPARIPTWANEGLAEAIAQDMVPRSTEDDRAVTVATYAMRRNKSLGGFFYAPALAYWQYGVARMMTQFMLREGKPQYAKFIEGIKKGQPWRKSLKKNMHVTPAQLTTAFGRSVQVPNLKP